MSPVDVTAAYALADQARALSLGTSTRVEIDRKTVQLAHAVRALARQVLTDDSVKTLGRREQVQRVLATMPTADALCFSAHAYMRDLARVLRGLASEYEARDNGAIPGIASPGEPVPKFSPAAGWPSLRGRSSREPICRVAR
jgi:hypothetical protein